jgi:PAS domain S-box-containing protein
VGASICDNLYYTHPSEEKRKKKGMLRENSKRDKFPELDVYRVELEMQNDELIKLHYDLEAERNKYYDLYDSAPIGYFSIDPQGMIRDINLTGASLLGVERSALIGKSFHRFIPGDSQGILHIHRQKLFKTKTHQAFEIKMKKANGTEFYAQMECRPACDMEGDIVYIRGVIVDITWRKLADEQIKKSLREKEVLLREIHHRVRNMLALVSSLLNLQVDSLEDEKVDRIVRTYKNQIKSISLVHEELYYSDDLARINVTEYIEELTGYLFSSFSSKTGTPTLDLQVDDSAMEIDKAIPCGLLINELVSNALKHAFPRSGEDSSTGKMEISVEFFLEDNQTYKLRILDTGVGLPENLDPENAGSLGFKLVNLLVRQLKGKLEIDRTAGTIFEVTFPCG